MNDWRYLDDNEIAREIASGNDTLVRLMAALDVQRYQIDRRLTRMVRKGRLARERHWTNGGSPYRYTVLAPKADADDPIIGPSIPKPTPVPKAPSPIAVVNCGHETELRFLPRLIEIADAAWQWEVADCELDNDTLFGVVTDRLRVALAGYRPRNVRPEFRHRVVGEPLYGPTESQCAAEGSSGLWAHQRAA